MLDNLDTLTLAFCASDNIIRGLCARSAAMRTNDLLSDLDLDRLAHVQFFQCDLQLQAHLGSTSFLVAMVTGSTTKELSKDIKRIVEPATALSLLLLQSFLAISIIDSLLVLV